MKNITVKIFNNGQLLSTIKTTKDNLDYIKNNVINMYGANGQVVVTK